MTDYILIRKPIKNVYIRVKDGQVTVTAPRSVSKARIDAFVEQKQAWIERQMTCKPIDLTGDADWVKARMDRYFDKWEPILGVHAKERRVRTMKTRWGSCNIAEKRIWLNACLSNYPEECLEYVIVHELCHLLERGHNARFYGFVQNCLPDWKRLRKILKDGLE